LKGWFSVHYQPEKQPKWDALRNDLIQRNNPEKQAEALQQIVLLSFSEAIPPHLLMPIIQHTATTMDHRVIKLLLLFLENVEIRDARGEIRAEFILITDAIRKLLTSPNEYVRGAAIRFLYKLNDSDICQQLLSDIIKNLSHSDDYVRWHAAHLIGRLARDIEGFNLDTADSIMESFSSEANPRVLPAMLSAAYDAAPKEALENIMNITQFNSQDMKISILRITIDAYQNFPQFRVRLLEIVVDFCEDESPTVRLQAANVLRQLSSNQAAVRTTASTYCDLLNTLTDENQRAFVVQALVEMAEEHRELLAPLALEMSQGTNIRGQLHAHLLNVLVQIVQKENALSLVPLITSKDKDSVEALRTLLLRFNETAHVIADSVGPFITDQNNSLAENASLLLKDCGIAGAKKEAFKYFASALDISGVESILARAMWSVAEFCDEPSLGADILIDLACGDSTPIASGTETIINEDGTYTTRQTTGASRTLKQLLTEGNSFLGLALISSLIKTKLRGAKVDNLNEIVQKVLGFAGVEKNAKDLCNLWLNAADSPNLLRLFRTSASSSFDQRAKSIEDNVQTEKQFIPATQPLTFSVLFNTAEEVPKDNKEVVDLPITQLTGPSDSLYVEASCSLRKFDRVYHFTLYNRTESTLTNILFEFTTVGSVSILQRNDVLSLAPGASGTFDLPVMISSGSCGTLFGDVSFDFAGAGGSDHQLLPLAPIDIDPFFCFEPTVISESIFRSKWSASVWERKIDINTEETDLLNYLNNIATKFKFAIITPKSQLKVTSQSANFITANLFTKSLFDEEVEMNVNAKLGKDGKISGFLRIRSQEEQLAFLFGKLIH
jgi:coatomer subunit beta